jgi:two-component system chemotaxis sensor kinase CheA
MSPATDLSQFHAVFFEETAEHLAAMESLLVAADAQPLDAEEVNAVFRAAHSIKGGAGTFGFTDLAEVTHEAETLLDRVRSGALTLAPAMVDALLAAVDVLKAQLAYSAGRAVAPPPEAGPVCLRLRELAAVAPTPRADTASRVAPAARCPVEVRIALPPGRDTMPDAVADGIEALVGEDDVAVTAEADGAWLARFATELDDAEIRERFVFAVDPALVAVRRLAPAVHNALPAASGTEDDFGFFADAPGAPVADRGFGFFPGAPGDPSSAEAVASPPRSAAPREVERTQAAAAEQGSIRVSVEKIDQLVNQVGELVITQAMLAQAAAALDPSAHQRIVNGVANLERNTRSLQESVLAIRMLPIAFVFNRFPRTVRDLAAKLGKQVRLEVQGEGTELDKGLIERIADPLTHLVRNSLDHGIEPPEARRAAGKPEAGVVTLRAGHQGGNILIQVADDGRGLDREKILVRARERGLAIADDASDAEVWQLIFEAGFSTAETVTDVSGRGVGMDVVRRNIASLGGTIEIASAPNLGTRITVRLPLTLAIMDGMSVAVGDELYILPLNAVLESMQVRADTLRTVAGRGRVADVRGEYLPVVLLHELFGVTPAGGEGVLVVVEAEGGRAALLVDELVGQHQVVVKSLEANYRKVAGLSGATIMGDGAVALILDIAALVATTRIRLAKAA